MRQKRKWYKRRETAEQKIPLPIKGGFRAYDNSISVNLIRSTTDPMLSQENYRHFIKLGIAFSSDGTDFDLLGLRDLFVENGTYIETDAHEGVLPLSDGWFTLSGKIGLSDIKEYAEGILFCLYGIEDTSEGVIRFEKNIISAVETDGLCNEIEPVGFSEKEICLRIKKGEVKFIFVRLKNSGNIRP